MGLMRVLQGASLERRQQSVVEAAYDHFRLDRQGNLVSANTLQHYDYLVVPCFEWLHRTHPEVDRFEDLDVSVLRHYRAEQAGRTSSKTGRPLEPATVLDSHRLLMTFLRWAAERSIRSTHASSSSRRRRCRSKSRPSITSHRCVRSSPHAIPSCHRKR